MSDSQNPGDAEDARPAGDPGHARARRVTSSRNSAKSRGSSTAARGAPAGQNAGEDAGEGDAERLRRRARFLRERNEARELRDRVQPRRTRTARMRQAMRMRTFRW